jgi:hypothetical protein
MAVFVMVSVDTILNLDEVNDGLDVRTTVRDG